MNNDNEKHWIQYCPCESWWRAEGGPGSGTYTCSASSFSIQRFSARSAQRTAVSNMLRDRFGDSVSLGLLVTEARDHSFADTTATSTSAPSLFFPPCRPGFSFSCPLTQIGCGPWTGPLAPTTTWITDEASLSVWLQPYMYGTRILVLIGRLIV